MRTRRLVSEALRRAAILPFTLLACGGVATMAGSGDGGAPETGGSGSGAGSSGGSGAGTGSSSGTSGIESGSFNGGSGASTGSSSGSSGSDGGSSGSSGSDASSGSSGVDGGSSGDSGGRCALASQTPTVSSFCLAEYTLSGDGSACSPGAYGALTPAQCASLCPPQATGPVQASYCSVTASTTPILRCSYGPCATGRRPEGLGVPETERADDAVARYLAEMAWLESASVPAFERLTRELEAHGAPLRLRDASRRAARDEVRHARRASEFGAEAGAVVGMPRVGPLGVRSLEAIAIENAVEGCVRETFGAAVAAVQAARAGNGRFRAAMKPIARDEARHAQLSWELATWFDEKLDADARSRVKQARDRAADALMQETSVEPDAAVARELGVPTATEAVAMARSLRASLWS